LGYKTLPATKAIEKAVTELGETADTESLIRQALKMMVAS